MLSRADFDLADSWQILCTLQSAWPRQSMGAKWQSGSLWQHAFQATPSIPTGARRRGPFVSAAHRGDGPTRCLPAELPSLLFNYEQVHLLPPAEPNLCLLMESIHHHPNRAEGHELWMRYFVFCLKGNKANSSNDCSQSSSWGQR